MRVDAFRSLGVFALLHVGAHRMGPRRWPQATYRMSAQTDILFPWCISTPLIMRYLQGVFFTVWVLEN